MAFEVVSSAFLSPFMGVLFDRLTSQELINLLREKTPIVKQIEELNILLLSSDKLLDYAEEKQIKDPKVKKWLDQMKEVVYRAGELMDKIDNEALRRQLEGESESRTSKVLSKLIPSSFNAFDNAVRSEMEDILQSLKSRLDQRGALGLKESREKKRFNRLPAPLVEESDVLGRDPVKEAIVESVLSDDAGGHNVSVIPIVGLGGIGKTTLAQLVYDHPRVKERFAELRVWVTVSTEFDLLRITKTILEKVTPQSCSIQDQHEVLFRLKEALANKKFLIVLDDVWNEDPNKWDALRSTFVSGMHGSKIIVTTQSRSVASIMASEQHHDLSQLSEEDSWQVFKKRAFHINEKVEEYPDLQAIGREIVKKCKGLPLAVKSLAGVLRSNRSLRKWKEILESSTWDLDGNMSDDVPPALWLSYHYLPSHLKRCFAYCAVFPKDYSFKRQELTWLWMAEGFLQAEAARNRMEDVGEHYVDDLISRSLFQRTESFLGETRFVMHDLVHDLAMYVSGDFCFHWDESKQLHDIASMTRHFSCKLQVDDLKKFEGLSKAERLHTFIQSASSDLGKDADYLKLLATIGCLRVLSLCGSHIKELPDSIGNLKNLRYFKLSRTNVKTLPDSICSLYNLETLILRDCHHLVQLQMNIGRLISLHHLDVNGCRKLRSICWPHEMDQSPSSISHLKQLTYLNISGTSVAKLPDSICSLINLRHLNTEGSRLEEMPLHMGNLKDMETLSDFVLSKHGGSDIKELGQLRQLHGSLKISGLENINDVEDAVKANLKDKENLNELALRWEGLPNDSTHERNLLQALQPHTNLRKIIISRYGGTCFPLWVGNSVFSKMESMELGHCQNCYSLPPLGNLPFLKRLWICDFDRVVIIGDEFYGCDLPFRSLEMLRIENMPEWKQWSSVEGNKAGAFPCLKILELRNCPKLSGGLPISSHTMETLSITQCGQLEAVTIDECGNLRSVGIWECSKLETFSIEKCGSLRSLSIEECSRFQFAKFSILENVRIKECGSLRSVSIEECSKLETVGIEKCSKLETVSIEKCGSLRRVSIEECSKLETVSTEEWGKLESLSIQRCGKLEIPINRYVYASIKNLTIASSPSLECFPLDNAQKLTFLEEPLPVHQSLHRMVLSGLPKLVSFPKGGLPAPNLKELWISTCENLMSLPVQMHTLLPSLENLYVEDCPKITSFPEGGLPAPNLKELWISTCENLMSLPIQMHTLLPSLESLIVVDCPKITPFPEGGLPAPNLKELWISTCENLMSLPIQMHTLLPSLESLIVEDCPKITSFPEGGLPASNLKELWISTCENLMSLPIQMHTLLPSLENLYVEDCPKITSFPEGGLPAPNLKELRISRCENLSSLPKQMQTLLPSLESLEVKDCPKITSFPEGGLPSDLKRLSIDGSHELFSRCMHGELQRLTPSLQSLSFGGCKDVLESFPSKGIIPSSVTSFSISDFPHLKALSSNAFPRLTHLKIYKCSEFQCLLEESLLNSLEELKIYECPLLEQQYRKEKREVWSTISHIPEVDISGNLARHK